MCCEGIVEVVARLARRNVNQSKRGWMESLRCGGGKTTGRTEDGPARGAECVFEGSMACAG